MHIAPANKETMHQAARIVRQGGLVAFATETVYGLGADATNGKAVAEIFALKGRPQFNPLIIHVHAIAMARQWVEWNDDAEKLAHAFWPGPLTLVLPRKVGSTVSLLASAGGDTLAIRLPAHDGARALIAEAGVPIAAPSANRSGRVSPTTAQHVYEEFGVEAPLIIDGGACRVGIESTVLDISGARPALLRPGFITSGELEDVLRQKIRRAQETPGAIKSPGQLASHYAPSLPVRLNALKPEADEALIAFGLPIPAGARETMNLSPCGDLREAAANLFATLRALDAPGFARIAVMPIPEEGLGIAINDRLRRAAQPRT